MKKAARIIICLAIVTVTFTIARSQAPSEGIINFQGYLTDAGDPVSGQYSITFRIWDSETGGSMLWNESRLVYIDDGYYAVNLGEVNPIPANFNDIRWMEIQIPGQQPLTPRYKMGTAPYALNSFSAYQATTVPYGAIGEQQLAELSVTTGKISDLAVTGEKIGNGVVGNSNIANGAVNNIKLADGSVNSAKIADGSILAQDINQNGAANGQVLKWNGSGWAAANDETGSGGDSDWLNNGNDIYRLDGRVGIGTMGPSEKLHVFGNTMVEGEYATLFLRTMNHNSPNRAKIIFDNNNMGLFGGNDEQDQIFGFYSAPSGNRSYDAKLQIHGNATGTWGRYLELTHDGTDGIISTDFGDISLSPAHYVGVGTATPSDYLTVKNTQGAFFSIDGGSELCGIRIRENNALRWSIFLRNYQSDNLIIHDELGGTDAMTVESGTGMVGIGVSDPIESLHTSGKIRCDGISGLNGGLPVRVYQNTLYYFTSLFRNDPGVETFSDNFGNILNVSPLSGIDKVTGKRELGYSPQDLVDAGLENLVVYDDNNNPQNVKYDMVPLYLVEVIKDQKQTISDLQNRIDNLSQRLERLEQGGER